MDAHTLALFLATVATATAALVAIVGGLLVSRVVSLATESSGLAHRRDDLLAQLVTERERQHELEQRLLRADAHYVLRPKYKTLAKVDPDIDLAAWIAEAEVDRTPEEIGPCLDEQRAVAAEARRRLAPIFEEDELPDFTFDDLVEHGVVLLPPGQRDMYDAVFDQMVKENTPPPNPRDRFAMLQDDLVRLTTATPTIYFTAGDHEAYAHTERELEKAKHRVAALDVQVEQARLALARVITPVGVRPGLGVLAYFAFVGALVPLFLLMYVDELRPWVPWLVLILFATGFLVLLGYVAWQVTHLTDSKVVSELQGA